MSLTGQTTLEILRVVPVSVCAQWALGGQESWFSTVPKDEHLNIRLTRIQYRWKAKQRNAGSSWPQQMRSAQAASGFQKRVLWQAWLQVKVRPPKLCLTALMDVVRPWCLETWSNVSRCLRNFWHQPAELELANNWRQCWSGDWGLQS